MAQSNDLQPVGVIHVRAGALGKGRAGQAIRGPLRQRRGEQVLHDQAVDRGQPLGGRGVDPIVLVAAADPQRRGSRRLRSPASKSSSVATRPMKWATTSSTPRRFGHFSARIVKPFWNVSSSPTTGTGPSATSGLRDRRCGRTWPAGRLLRRSDAATARPPAGRPRGAARRSRASDLRPFERARLRRRRGARRSSAGGRCARGGSRSGPRRTSTTG